VGLRAPWLLLAALLVACALAAPAHALDDGLARTPPMGWNTFNRFGCDINEQLVRESADAMVSSGMRAAGYRYVNLDDCWMAFSRDSRGRLRADPARFPGGIPALATYVHRRGLKLGLYTDLGTRTCAGFPGLQGHEQDDLRRIASWGVDYLKVDFCHTSQAVRRDPRPYFARVRDILRATRRPIVFSIVTWGIGAPWHWGARTGHLWRVSPDLLDRWSSLLKVVRRNRRLARYAGPGGWNDADMLQVGNGSMTATEYRAHFSLWAMMASPLLAGNDLRRMDAATRRTLLNREVIAVDQDRAGIQGHLARSRRGREVWVKRLRGGDRTVLLFNRARRRATIRASLPALGLPRARRYRVRDLWRHRSRRTGRVLRARVPRHGVAMFRVSRPGG
jgi:alpha-galactosidase